MALQRWWVGTVAMAGLVATCAWLAPFLYAEYLFDLHGGVPVPSPRPTLPLSGRWLDDYFVVQTLDPTTFAIGEPRYYQGNYSYLIVGTRRAVLFDAGTGLRDIRPVVRSLTSLPVTVVASHLHFDHVGALGRLGTTAMLDVPSLRARATDSRLTLQRYEFLGFADRLATPVIRVDEWWAPGSLVDLGDRRLRLLATPGHTPTSVSLYDAARREIFVGDFLYPGELYAFLPGASRRAYRETTAMLLSILDPATRIYAAHMQEPADVVEAPVLGVADLHALQVALQQLQDGTASPAGLYPRRIPVRGPITFATGWPWNNR